MSKSLAWMESTDAKIARAKIHLGQFQSDADRFVRQARPTFIRKTNQECTAHWLVAFCEHSLPPIELSVVVGDFLHNLRSALDNLICGLVHTVNPGDSCCGRQFPIYDDCAKYLKDRKGALRGVPKDARTVIDGLQPHLRPKNAQHLDPLWILNTLCNRDKHRTANLTFGYNKDVEILIPLRNGGSYHVRATKPLYFGDVETIPLDCDPGLIDDQVQMHIGGRTILLFRSPNDAWAERSVDEVLIACLDYVENRVIARFKPFFR